MGELAALASALAWAVASLLFTKLGKSLGPLALNWAKCALALVLLALTLLAVDGVVWPRGLGAAETGWLALSAVIGLGLGDTVYFRALSDIGPRRTLVIWALAPAMTALAAVPALGEDVTTGMLAGIALTTAGVVWVIQERAVERAPPLGSGSRARSGGSDVSAPPEASRARRYRRGVAFAVLAMLCQATANITTKAGGGEISALSISVVRLAFGVASLTLVVALRGSVRAALAPLRDRRIVIGVAVATLIGTYLGIWLSMAGLRYTLVGIASALSSTSPIWILPLAAIFLGERLSARAVLGAFVAVAGVAVLFLL